MGAGLQAGDLLRVARSTGPLVPYPGQRAWDEEEEGEDEDDLDDTLGARRNNLRSRRRRTDMERERKGEERTKRGGAIIQ